MTSALLIDHKQYEITFVGRTTTYRPKRTNLLAMLQKDFSVNVAQDVSVPEMMDLFSQSKIVPNENLFNGLYPTHLSRAGFRLHQVLNWCSWQAVFFGLTP